MAQLVRRPWASPGKVHQRALCQAEECLASRFHDQHTNV